MCAAILPISTAGLRKALPVGPMPTCFLISAGLRPQGGTDAYRGDSGPLTVSSPMFPDPLLDVPRSRKSLGLPRTPDFNGAQQEGFTRGQSTVRNGRRCSAAVAYLRPALSAAISP